MPNPENKNQDEAVLEMSISAAVQRFLTALSSGHSSATVRTYQVGIGRFCFYLKEHLKIDPDTHPIAQLQTQWAVDCVTWLSQGQPSDINPAGTGRAARTTLATYIAGITRFYRWCSRQKLILLPSEEYDRLVENLSDLRGKIKTNILSKVPADEVIEKLLEVVHKYDRSAPTSQADSDNIDVAKEDEAHTEKSGGGFRAPAAKMAELDQRRYELIHLRNIALLETLKCTGARVSEIVALTRGDLDATNKRALVVGKGQKERWVYFDSAAWQALQIYFTARTKLMASTNIIDSNESSSANSPAAKRSQFRRASSKSTTARELAAQPLFSRHDRGAGWKKIKPLTTNAIRTILWELVEQAELETHITPHKFRHWFATRMLSETGDLAVTQDLLGHADPGTTRIYAQVSETNKQKAFRQVFN